MKSRLMPTRTGKKDDMTLVANLDDIVTRGAKFQLHGREHSMKPLTTQQFLEYSNAMAALWDLEEKKGITAKELIDVYFKAIVIVVPTICREDIENATQQQIAGLYQIVYDFCMGKLAMSQDEKKKIMERAIAKEASGKKLPN